VFVWFRIYLNDILCKNYNYIFLFVQVMPKKIVVPFFLDTVYKPIRNEGDQQKLQLVIDLVKKWSDESRDKLPVLDHFYFRFRHLGFSDEYL